MLNIIIGIGLILFGIISAGVSILRTPTNLRGLVWTYVHHYCTWKYNRWNVYNIRKFLLNNYVKRLNE